MFMLRSVKATLTDASSWGSGRRSRHLVPISPFSGIPRAVLASAASRRSINTPMVQREFSQGPRHPVVASGPERAPIQKNKSVDSGAAKLLGVPAVTWHVENGGTWCNGAAGLSSVRPSGMQHR